MPSISIDLIITLVDPSLNGSIIIFSLPLSLDFLIDAILASETEIILWLRELIETIFSTETIFSFVNKFGANPSVVGKSFKTLF